LCSGLLRVLERVTVSFATVFIQVVWESSREHQRAAPLGTGLALVVGAGGLAGQVELRLGHPSSTAMMMIVVAIATPTAAA
jgi:hypothetical protein